MRLGVAICALLGLGPSAVARAAPARLGMRAEVGAEYDSNAGRVEHVQGGVTRPEVGSPLFRLVLSGEASTPVGSRQAASLWISGAGKRFLLPDAQSEDVLVAESTGVWNVRVAGRTNLALSGAYYDVFQRDAVDPRDFRSLSPMLRLDRALGDDGLLTVGVGYRWLTYKPDSQFDFAGPTAFLSYRQLFPAAAEEAEWELSGGASAELRDFAGNRCLVVQVEGKDVVLCPGPASAGKRRDEFWTAHVEATRTGAFLVGAGLAAQGNASNSFGEPLVRGLGYLRATLLLPAELSLSGRGEFVFARYLNGQPLGRDAVGQPLVNIEEESRSTVRAELVRPFGAHVDLGLRYSFYTNEIGTTAVRYRRHTAMLFLAVMAAR
jgi:hypothetical protein